MCAWVQDLGVLAFANEGEAESDLLIKCQGDLVCFINFWFDVSSKSFNSVFVHFRIFLLALILLKCHLLLFNLTLMFTFFLLHGSPGHLQLLLSH